MHKTFLLLGFVCLSITSVSADMMRDYWVVGSFKESESARIEQQRLAYWIPNSIKVASVLSKGESRFRLLMNEKAYAAHKDKLHELGINAWKSKINPSAFKAPTITARLGANLNYVLVLAGFKDGALAEEHAESLRGESDESIQVVKAQVSNRDYYRVVSGPYDAELAAVRDQFVLMGVDDAWWLDVPGKALVTRKPEAVEATDSDSMQEALKRQATALRRQAVATSHIPVVDSSISAVPAGMVLSPPDPGESYIEYCIRKANAAEREQYCGDGEFLSQQDKRVGAMGEEKLFKYCATEATGAERRKYCGNSHLSERGSR